MRRRLLVTVAILALLTQMAPFLGPQPASASSRLVLAFYYTWFDENSWSSSQVPDVPLQTYASRDRSVMDRHVAQAQAAGIDAFVVSWYGPWGGANNQTEGNFATMLDVAAARGFRLAVDVEVTSPFVGSAGQMVEMLRHALQVHAGHPAYLRVDGRPVLFFWRQQRFDLGTWQWIRDQVDPGRQSIWIAEGVDMAFQAVFDGHHLYSVTWNPPTDVSYTASKFSRYVANARQQYGGYRYWVATVMPGYDDTRTGRSNAFARGREGGAYYANTWQAAIASNPDWVIITSWNEWPEGTYIEPSQAYGDLYGQLTAQWAGRYKQGSTDSPTAGPPLPVATPTPRATPAFAAVEVRAQVLNVRSAPDLSAQTLGQVPAGSVLRATARLADDSWWQICCLNDRPGWVSGDWVDPAGPPDQLRRLPGWNAPAARDPSWLSLPQGW